MNQLTFQFPFKTVYEKKDFYVSTNNFEAYKLIESWPKWPNKFLNIIMLDAPTTTTFRPHAILA